MRSVALALADGRTIAHDVRVADSFFARNLSLLRRRELAPHEGLLLIPGGSIHTIGLRFAIDVLFLDRRMRVVSLAPDLAPHRFCLAPRRTTSVLQLAAGRIVALGLLIGMYIVVLDDDASADVQGTAMLRASPSARCSTAPIQFSLRLPLRPCARVESTLGRTKQVCE